MSSAVLGQKCRVYWATDDAYYYGTILDVRKKWTFIKLEDQTKEVKEKLEGEDALFCDEARKSRLGCGKCKQSKNGCGLCEATQGCITMEQVQETGAITYVAKKAFLVKYDDGDVEWLEVDVVNPVEEDVSGVKYSIDKSQKLDYSYCHIIYSGLFKNCHRWIIPKVWNKRYYSGKGKKKGQEAVEDRRKEMQNEEERKKAKKGGGAVPKAEEAPKEEGKAKPAPPEPAARKPAPAEAEPKAAGASKAAATKAAAPKRSAPPARKDEVKPTKAPKRPKQAATARIDSDDDDDMPLGSMKAKGPSNSQEAARSAAFFLKKEEKKVSSPFVPPGKRKLSAKVIQKGEARVPSAAARALEGSAGNRGKGKHGAGEPPPLRKLTKSEEEVWDECDWIFRGGPDDPEGNAYWDKKQAQIYDNFRKLARGERVPFPDEKG